MTPELAARFVLLRDRLLSAPLGPTFGEIATGNPSAHSGSTAYDAVLRVADGGMFGRIDLFPQAALAGHAYRLRGLEDAAEWVIIGQVLYVPIVMSRSGSSTALVGENDALEALGDLDDLLAACVEACRYAALAPELPPDDWQRFLETV
ncbi:hypothetical protein [Paracoccus aminophilus]|uniref:Uncharacterized protein n=1 Tax=Paracoccus aminophilus JCM 7686 TaxID=1367847 RepID=S5Y2N2_PARAH|nr:hypothetical protein [Paracoccus aminophilus]AGT10000.1 hypothetical protein JCM7686_2964 [Paracoccus aminophilus JCM 7686]